MRPGLFSHAEAELFHKLRSEGVPADGIGGLIAVTLQPCVVASQSRLGISCTERLIRASIKRIHVGAIDERQPNLEYYARLGIDATLTASERLRRVCARLSEIFSIYGDEVNFDIQRVKRDFGVDAFLAA